MSDDSAYRNIVLLSLHWILPKMGRGRNEYGSVPEHLRDRLERKDRYLIDRGASLFKELVKCTRGKNNSFRIFSLKELQKATNNFSAYPIVEDYYRRTYRGIIEDRHVAVKICTLHTLLNEVVSLSLIKHRNVVKLLGCCLETCFPIVVHELPPNGTLEENISKLSWTDRLRIATEIADALAYLHSELHMTHRCLGDPEAVLLDEFHSAKLGEFDLSEIQNLAESSNVETGIRNNLSRKLKDVYDFGSILLNLLFIQKRDRRKFTECKEKAEILKYLQLNKSEKEMPQIEAYIHLLLTCRKVFDHVSMEEDGELIMEEDKVPSMEEVARELLCIRRLDSPSDLVYGVSIISSGAK